MNEKILAILDLWFGKTEPGNVPPEKIQKMWWTPDRSLDSFLRQKYETDLKKAAAGELEHWKETSRGTLALIILLDQFPRNIYRGTPEAFSFDGMALSVAEEGIKKGYDRKLHPVMRIFFYLPYMHSEDPEYQERCVELFKMLESEFNDNEGIRSVISNSLDFAVRHKEVIDRFGRFPHRNEILGRKSTPEEIEFLKQPGSSF